VQAVIVFKRLAVVRTGRGRLDRSWFAQPARIGDGEVEIERLR